MEKNPLNDIVPLVGELILLHLCHAYKPNAPRSARLCEVHPQPRQCNDPDAIQAVRFSPDSLLREFVKNVA